MAGEEAGERKTGEKAKEDDAEGSLDMGGEDGYLSASRSWVVNRVAKNADYYGPGLPPRAAVLGWSAHPQKPD